MKQILEQHIDTEIGVNISKPLHIDPVKLVSVHDDYFTVVNEQDGNIYHLPYLNIVKIIENPAGVTVSGFFRQHRTFPFVVKIGHLIEYMPT